MTREEDRAELERVIAALSSSPCYHITKAQAREIRHIWRTITLMVDDPILPSLVAFDGLDFWSFEWNNSRFTMGVELLDAGGFEWFVSCREDGVLDGSGEHAEPWLPPRFWDHVRRYLPRRVAV